MSLLLEDDIALSGPRWRTTQEQKLGLKPWPTSSSSSSSSSQGTAAVAATSSGESESAFTAGLRSLFDELKDVARNDSSHNLYNGLRSTGISSSASSSNAPNVDLPKSLFGASDAPLNPAAAPVEDDPGFDVVLLGDCVFTHWQDKYMVTTQRSDHLFQVGGAQVLHVLSDADYVGSLLIFFMIMLIFVDNSTFCYGVDSKTSF